MPFVLGGKSLQSVSNKALPWHCLVCCAGYAAPNADLTQRVSAILREFWQIEPSQLETRRHTATYTDFKTEMWVEYCRVQAPDKSANRTRARRWPQTAFREVAAYPILRQDRRVGNSSSALLLLLPYGVESSKELCSSSRNGSPEFFSFSSSRAVQSQSPQAQGSEPFWSRHLRRSWASCTLTKSKYSSQ